MSARLRRVVVTGSECTGKTTLAAELARHYATAWAPEAARAYAERVARPLTVDDVEGIARAQAAADDGAAGRARGGLLLLDTDLVSTVVYARHYYGACPAWVESATLARRGDLYLLLDPDVPWIADGVRDRPDGRAHLHAAFVDALRAFGARTVAVTGDWDTRRAVAVAAVDALLSR